MRFMDQVEIVTAGGEEDEYGEVYYDWDHPTVLATIPATVYTVSPEAWGNSNDAAGAPYPMSIHRKVILPADSPQINISDHRVRWGGHLYQIVSDSGVIPRGRFPHHREIEISRWNV